MEKIADLEKSFKPFGALYIVATPIGNLEDISLRAIKVLQSVDLILAENPRHSEKLLSHYQIRNSVKLLHDHNERDRTQEIIEWLKSGKNIAIISDAGTPLISDPGFITVCNAKKQGIAVIPIPGPSAVITALSASGMPCHSFAFEGFLPAKTTAREEKLKKLTMENRTLIFYEAPHRILETISSMKKILGNNREACIAKELTKQFEKIFQGTLDQIYSLLITNEKMQQGEFVIIISGQEQKENTREETHIDPFILLKYLLEVMPLKQACQLAEKITGIRKNIFYQQGLEIKNQN